MIRIFVECHVGTYGENNNVEGTARSYLVVSSDTIRLINIFLSQSLSIKVTTSEN